MLRAVKDIMLWAVRDRGASLKRRNQVSKYLDGKIQRMPAEPLPDDLLLSKLGPQGN